MFSGVELLAYCVMTNHVHILVFVPEPEELSDDEVLSRMRILYRDSRFAALTREWDERLKLGRTAAFLRFRGTFTRRMWNASRTYFTLKYLSPLAAGGYIAPAGNGSPTSSRRAYKLTRKGKEVAQLTGKIAIIISNKLVKAKKGTPRNDKRNSSGKAGYGKSARPV